MRCGRSASASLALILLPPRRLAYLLGFFVCAGLMGWALWLQYGLDLEPCPLCVFQRIAVIVDRRRIPDRGHPQSGPHRRRGLRVA